LVLVPVSINAAARQFSHSSLASLIIKQLELHDLPPSLIDIEVTESGIMVDDEDTRWNLAALQRIGVKLYIDDFGTGYASLSQLQRLRMDGLKVDRSFTSALSGTAEGAVFYRAIISMARALGMTVVAEGVESEAEWKILKELGCDEIQGFLMSRPLPANRIPQLLRERRLKSVE
jgi:EAL domain-containing protein (putative c-di-GMP-specific phosphodiesterase class I)